MARADVRIRIRESVIRIHVSETALRTVIRITAPQAQLSSPSSNRPAHNSQGGFYFKDQMSFPFTKFNIPSYARREPKFEFELE